MLPFNQKGGREDRWGGEDGEEDEEMEGDDSRKGGRALLEEIILSLNSENLAKLLGYIKDWNTSSRTGIVAQQILVYIFDVYSPASLAKLPKMKDVCVNPPSLLPPSSLPSFVLPSFVLLFVLPSFVLPSFVLPSFVLLLPPSPPSAFFVPSSLEMDDLYFSVKTWNRSVFLLAEAPISSCPPFILPSSSLHPPCILP
jgi:hypothetical protein